MSKTTFINRYRKNIDYMRDFLNISIGPHKWIIDKNELMVYCRFLDWKTELEETIWEIICDMKLSKKITFSDITTIVYKNLRGSAYGKVFYQNGFSMHKKELRPFGEIIDALLEEPENKKKIIPVLLKGKRYIPKIENIGIQIEKYAA